MKIATLLDTFVLNRQPSPYYLQSLKRTVRRLAEYGIAEVCQLDSSSVNKMLAGMTQYASETRANIRRETCTLWRFAHEIGATDTLPTRVARVRVNRLPAQAWSLDDLARMVRCARGDKTPVGGRSGLTIRQVMPAWILVGYDTGLRFTDMLLLRATQIRQGRVCVVEHKTGKTCVLALSGASRREISPLLGRSPDGTVFSWILTRRRAFLMWRAFLDRHDFIGSSRWLRRSAATYVEKQRRGEATVFLRHSAPHLAKQHYIDQTLLDPALSPPELAVG